MNTKTCSKCQRDLSLSAFWKDAKKPDGLKPSCADCEKKRNRKYYAKNRAKMVRKTQDWRKRNNDKFKSQMERQRAKLRSLVLAAYGNKCSCCGEMTPVFLTLEHINGNGFKHRQVRGTYGVYRDVIKSGFPGDYTILCMNCNHAQRFNRICPHELARAALAKAKGDVS